MGGGEVGFIGAAMGLVMRRMLQGGYLYARYFCSRSPLGQARATIGYLVYKEGTSTTMLRTAETLSTQGPVLIPTLSKVPGPMRKGQLDSGRRTKESLAMDLTFHMWMRKHGLTQIIDCIQDTLSSRAALGLPALGRVRRASKGILHTRL